MKGKIKTCELLIISKRLIKPKKKFRLNKEIEKEHTEKEYIPNEMLNIDVNSRFLR
tara:strand:+ start:3535 stop:3702 length:168 start_codon:yes stop_codon:yes gene_type:complete